MESTAENVEVIPLPEVADSPFHGHQGVRQFFGDRRIAEEVEYSVSKFRGTGDLVVMLGRVRRRRLGALVDAPAAWIGALRDGKLVRSESFSTWDEALGAAGIESEP